MTGLQHCTVRPGLISDSPVWYLTAWSDIWQPDLISDSLVWYLTVWSDIWQSGLISDSKTETTPHSPHLSMLYSIAWSDIWQSGLISDSLVWYLTVWSDIWQSGLISDSQTETTSHSPHLSMLYSIVWSDIWQSGLISDSQRPPPPPPLTTLVNAVQYSLVWYLTAWSDIWQSDRDHPPLTTLVNAVQYGLVWYLTVWSDIWQSGLISDSKTDPPSPHTCQCCTVWPSLISDSLVWYLTVRQTTPHSPHLSMLYSMAWSDISQSDRPPPTHHTCQCCTVWPGLISDSLVWYLTVRQTTPHSPHLSMLYSIAWSDISG